MTIKRTRTAMNKTAYILYAAFLLLAFVPSQSHAQDTSTGLVGHWMLDETSGTTAVDSAGSTNGTMQAGLDAGTASAAGVIGTALDFTPNNTINLGDYDMNSDFSISVWFNADVVDSAWRAIVMRDNNYGIETRFGNLYFRVGDTWSNDVSTGGLSADTWYHAVLTYDGVTDTITGYLDGASLGTNTSSFTNTNDDTAIGSWSNFQEYFDGTIDDVRFYDRVLTPDDVTALYNRTSECLPSVAGEMIYNENYRVMQYCDGTGWQSMGKGASIIHGEKTEGNNYGINAVEFDGTSDYIEHTTALSGVSDTKTMTGSFWIKNNNLGVFQRILETRSTGDAAMLISIGTGDQIRFFGDNTSDTLILDMDTPNSTVDGTWQHVLFSFDLSNPSNRHIYVNDVDSFDAAAVYTDDFLDVTGNINNLIGAQNGGLTLFDGEMADVWIDFGTYIDLSVAANRRLFTDASGNAIDLGNDGSGPTGSAPDIFLSGDTGTWHTNKGTGGGFTEVGALADATTAPPSETARSLVGWWRLDEASGTLVDASGNGNDSVTETNITYGENGPTSQSIGFNGTDSFVEIANSSSLDLGNAITVALWVKTPGYPTTPPTERIISKGNAFAGGTNGAWGIITNTGNIRSRVIGPLGEASGSGTSPPPDTWIHYAFTYDGTTLTDYYNGAFNSSDTQATGDFSRSAIPVLIGELDSGGQHYEGLIDDVRIYNFALDANQIDELYHASSDFYTPNAVEFDGTNDWLDTASATGLTDGSKGTISAWFKVDENTADRRILRNATARVIIWYDATGEMRIWGEDSSNANLLDLRTTGFGGDTTGWHHLLASWDLSDPTKRHLYIDGVSDMSVVNFTNGNIDYSNGFYRIGANSAGSDLWDGYMADVWFDHDTYIDLSNPNERAKFIDENGGAVYLGANGEIPTGASPDIFLSGDTGTWHTNDGTLAGFTENGALADAPTAPAGSKQPRYCSNPTQPEGTLIYNDDEDVMQYCDGFTYRPLGPPGDGGGGCSNPSGSAGFMYYNTDFSTLMYCEGDEWIGVRGDPTTSLLASGLIGHWKLDETSGTTAADSSGNGNDGTMTSMTGAANTVPAPINSSGLNFDNASPSDYITIADDAIFDTIATNNAITLSIWTNKQSDQAGFRALLHRQRGSAGTDSWGLYYNTNDNYGFISSGVTIFDTGVDANADIGEWVHFAATNDGTTARVYRNGIEIGSTPYSGTFSAESNPISIGVGENSGVPSTGEMTDAYLADARVYNRALSPGEIQALYNLGTVLDPCTTGAIGTRCTSDGAIYAGTTVGGARMYAAACDAGMSWNGSACTGSQTTLQWKTSNTTTAGTTSTTDGVANTDAIATAGIADHPAAEACRNIGSEWYLPAQDELDLMWENLVDQNGDDTPGGPLGSTYDFDTTNITPGGVYYSSSEFSDNSSVHIQGLNNGIQLGTGSRMFDFAVRCVRR